jgi:hypothetical protein
MRFPASSIIPWLVLSLAGSASPPNFPLKVAGGGRYLVDQSGKPFFISGDSPWDIFQNPTGPDIKDYLDDRQKRGFNTLLVTMVADRHDSMRGRNGLYPFDAPLDFTKPNAAYWQRVDEVMEEMARRGFLVVSCPTWLGAGRVIWRDGVTEAAMAVYGKFLVERYGKYRNLIWLLGGDRNPEPQTDSALRLLGRVLHQGAPHQLITYHPQSEHSSAQFFGDEPWHAINSAYTYRLSYLQVRREFQRSGRQTPLWLSETGYEGENTGGHMYNWRRDEIRKQHWWAMTSGALGSAHGSKEVWWFGPEWRKYFDGVVNGDIQQLRHFAESRRWWLLRPDLEHRLLVSQTGVEGTWDYSTAALASDGSWGLVYLAGGGRVTVDTALVAGKADFYWIDPVSGSRSKAEGKTSSRGAALRDFDAPEVNSTGEHDWVLEISTTN